MMLASTIQGTCNSCSGGIELGPNLTRELEAESPSWDRTAIVQEAEAL